MLAANYFANQFLSCQVENLVSGGGVHTFCMLQLIARSQGLIPRQRNTSRETVYAKYGWLHVNNSIEFSLREQKIRFAIE